MNKLTRFDPFEEMRALQRQFFGDDWGRPLTEVANTMPATDVYTRDDKEMVVEVHLPNFEENDVDINIDNGALVISAEKREKEEDKQKKYVVRESSTSFYKRILLPDHADDNKVDAHLENGVPTVTVPFKELPKPKKIDIKKKR